MRKQHPPRALAHFLELKVARYFFERNTMTLSDLRLAVWFTRYCKIPNPQNQGFCPDWRTQSWTEEFSLEMFLNKRWGVFHYYFEHQSLGLGCHVNLEKTAVNVVFFTEVGELKLIINCPLVGLTTVDIFMYSTLANYVVISKGEISRSKRHEDTTRNILSH